jgi:multidrug efflux pump subunit AcrA (membrane-fusion protein)
LADEEFNRLKKLWEQQATSDSAMDKAQSALFGYQSARQQTQNQLDLIPVERRLLKASIKVLEVQLEQATRELGKCTIKLPFAARCASRTAEADQFVAAGERLGTFLALDRAEVVVMVETRKIRALFPRGIAEFGPLDQKTMDLGESVYDRVEVPVEVRWGPRDESPVWHGRVTRVGSGLDASTRTVPVIVEVPEPYQGAIPGVRPPLLPDVFCHVTFFGATVDDVVVIPRDCLHETPERDGRSSTAALPTNGGEYSVYLLRDGALEIAEVGVLSQEDDFAVIEAGIDDGDLVILTDLFPVSEGMPLEGELDETVAARVAAAGRLPAASTAAEACP